MSDSGQLKNTEMEKQSPEETQDEFSLDSLRLPQDFTSEIGVRKVITAVSVRKPDKQWFVRVHPSPGYRLPAAILELKDEGESYLIAPSLRVDLVEEISFKVLLTAINRHEQVFLWPVPLPRPDGRPNTWNASHLAAAEQAKTRWIRMLANMQAQAYDVYAAKGELQDPEWPDIGFQELLFIAFPPERRIDSLDHDVVKRLRGQI